MAVAYLSQFLNREISLKGDKRIEELTEIAYAKYEWTVLGRRPAAPNFFDNY